MTDATRQDTDTMGLEARADQHPQGVTLTVEIPAAALRQPTPGDWFSFWAAMVIMIINALKTAGAIEDRQT